MNPFTRQMTWPGWKFGVLKISIVVFGILMGTLFADVLRPMTAGLWIVFGVTAALSSVWGVRGMFDGREAASGSKRSAETES
jgi:hypothetical protein